VAASLKAQEVPFVTRTSGGAVPSNTQVFLVDTLGELPPFYAAGDVAFVGGTLVPIGGHNLLEPAALSLPILAGPHNFNSADIAKMLVEHGAVRIAQDAPTLAALVGDLLSDPTARASMGASGRKAVDDNRGAVARLMQFLEPLLS
jgi:3-deoxy-D-manno-octulosonic-acid transferase